MSWLQRFVALALACAMPGCSSPVDEQQLQAADQVARSTIEALRVEGIQGVRRTLKPETAALPEVEREVAKMRDALPAGTPDAVQLLDGEVERDGEVIRSKLKYVVRKGESSSEVDVWLERSNGPHLVETLRVVKVQ